MVFIARRSNAAFAAPRWIADPATKQVIKMPVFVFPKAQEIYRNADSNHT
jgi:hypothetical protein